MIVLSLGAGVQSSTLALMAAAGDIGPMPDCAIFADTLWEPKAVYQQVDWLRSVLPFPIYTVSAGNIKRDILMRRSTDAGRFASLPWYTKNPDGTHGIGQRQCTDEYKLAPIAKKCRQLLSIAPRRRAPKGSVEMWIGISIDEVTRMKPSRKPWMTNRWPLIEAGISRLGCLRWLAEHGYPEPPKSACIGCPFHRDSAWLEMQRTAPDEFADAVAVDAAIRQGHTRGIRAVEFMHDSRLPMTDAIERAERDKREQPDLFQNECEGHCGV